MSAVRVIDCASGCKAFLPIEGNTLDEVEEEIKPAGWLRLSVVIGKFRCPACSKALDEAQRIVGTDGAFTPDPLPKDSIGALHAPRGLMSQPSVSTKVMGATAS